MIRPAQLHGAWALSDFRIAFADGRPALHPFGPDARGMLLYTPCGQMQAILTRAHRAPLHAGRLETAHRAEAEAKAQAFDSYLSYGGTWTLEGDEVVHHVTHALMPELVGQHNRRRVDVEALDATGALVLSYQLTPRSGITRTYRLRWARP